MRKADLRANLMSDDAVFGSAIPSSGRTKHSGMPIKAHSGYPGARTAPGANQGAPQTNVNGGGMAAPIHGGAIPGQVGSGAQPTGRRPPPPLATPQAYHGYPHYATSQGAPPIPQQPMQPQVQQQQPYYGAQQPQYVPQVAYGGQQPPPLSPVGYPGGPQPQYQGYQPKPVAYAAQQAPPLPPYPQQQPQAQFGPQGQQMYRKSEPPINPYDSGRSSEYPEHRKETESHSYRYEAPHDDRYRHSDHRPSRNGHDDGYDDDAGYDSGWKDEPDEQYSHKEPAQRPRYKERKSSSHRRYVSPDYPKKERQSRRDEDYSVPSSISPAHKEYDSADEDDDPNPFESPRQRKLGSSAANTGRNNVLRTASRHRRLSPKHSSGSLSPDESPDKRSVSSNSQIEQDRINKLEDKIQRLERALRVQKSGSESDLSVGSATKKNGSSSNSLIPSEDRMDTEYDDKETPDSADDHNDYEYDEIEGPGSLTYSGSIYRTGFEKAGYHFDDSKRLGSSSQRKRKGAQPRMPEIDEHLSKPSRNFSEHTTSSSVYSDRKPSTSRKFEELHDDGDEDDEGEKDQDGDDVDTDRYFNDYEYKYERRHDRGNTARSTRGARKNRHNDSVEDDGRVRREYSRRNKATKYDEDDDGERDEEVDRGRDSDRYNDDDVDDDDDDVDDVDDVDDGRNERYDRLRSSARRRQREPARTHTESSFYGKQEEPERVPAERAPRKKSEAYRAERYERPAASQSRARDRRPSPAVKAMAKPVAKPAAAPAPKLASKPGPVYKGSRSDLRVDQVQGKVYGNQSNSSSTGELKETRFSPMIKPVPVIKFSSATSTKVLSNGMVRPTLPSQSRESVESVVARFRNTRQKALHDYKMFTPRIQFFWAVTLLETVARNDVLSRMAIDGNLRRRPVPAKSLRTQRKQFVSTAVKVLEKLVQTSPMETRARLYLADLYSGGIHPGVIEKDEKAGFSMFYDAATKQKDPVAAYRVACCLEAGVGCRKDSQQSMHFFKQAAMLGDPSAMCQLGMMYFAGANGFPVDIGKSILWHKNAADRLYDREVMGYDTLISARSFSDARGALYTLAKIYQTDLNLLSLNNDSQRSRNVIGSLERLDAFCNKQKSLSYFLEAAKVGHTDAQAVLGYYYSKGFLPTPKFKPDKRSSNGVKDQIEPRRSIYWYSKAAQQNHAYAALGLAKWYGSGAPDKSLEKNEQQAFLWGRKAADEGKLPEAEFMIGLCFEQGFGTTVNPQMSLNYYKRSASKGYGRAISKVGSKM